MNVLVCCKPVPRGIRSVKLLESKGTVECEGVSFLMNECDEYALEAALLWKRRLGAEVTVLTVGGIRFQDILYLALAKGADKAIRIDADQRDSGIIAHIIAEAVKEKDYDLIITGVESEDNMATQVSILLAEKLGWPFALAVTKVDFGENQYLIKVTTEIGGGIQEELEIRLPAVLAIQSGITLLSYAAPAKIMRARKMPLGSKSLRELGIKLDEWEAKRAKIISVFDPPKAEYAEIVSGSPEQVAEKIMSKVKHALG